MTSSNGNLFRATGYLCGEFTGEFPAQRPVMWSFDVFLICAWTNNYSKNGDTGDLLWRQCNVNHEKVRPVCVSLGMYRLHSTCLELHRAINNVYNGGAISAFLDSRLNESIHICRMIFSSNDKINVISSITLLWKTTFYTVCKMAAILHLLQNVKTALSSNQKKFN